MSRTPDLMEGCVRMPGEALNHEGYRGLVARFAPINQGPGGMLLYDSSRRGPPGALTNMTVADWESSHLGTVLNIPALNSGIVVPNRANLEPLEVSIRIVFRSRDPAWVGNMYLLRKGGAQYDYASYISNVGQVFVAFNDGVLRTHGSAGGLIVESLWYDLLFSIGNGRLRCWLNGALIIDDAEVNPMPQTGADLVLGGNQVAGNSLMGKLALVEIWDYCLPKPISLDPHFLAYAE